MRDQELFFSVRPAGVEPTFPKYEFTESASQLSNRVDLQVLLLSNSVRR